MKAYCASCNKFTTHVRKTCRCAECRHKNHELYNILYPKPDPLETFREYEGFTDPYKEGE
jgi:hypothetical protein